MVISPKSAETLSSKKKFDHSSDTAREKAAFEKESYTLELKKRNQSSTIIIRKELVKLDA